jgi:hypothetical protein
VAPLRVKPGSLRGLGPQGPALILGFILRATDQLVLAAY